MGVLKDSYDMNRNTKLAVIDAICSALALYSSFLIRFEFTIADQFKELLLTWIPLFIVFQIITFSFCGLYARIWRYTSLSDLYAILTAASISCGLSFLSRFCFLWVMIVTRDLY